jgi:peptidoglycan hydrolase CwlO-like protein
VPLQLSAIMTSTAENVGDDEDLLCDLSRDKALLKSKVGRLEDTVLSLMSKLSRNEDIIKEKDKEIKDLSKAVKCDLAAELK